MCFHLLSYFVLAFLIDVLVHVLWKFCDLSAMVSSYPFAYQKCILVEVMIILVIPPPISLPLTSNDFLNIRFTYSALAFLFSSDLMSPHYSPCHDMSLSCSRSPFDIISRVSVM